MYVWDPLLIGGYLFLGGLAGGAMILAFLLDYTDREQRKYYPAAKVLAYIAPVALAVGMLLLLLDLERLVVDTELFHVLNVFSNPTSLMTIGSAIIVVAIVWGCITAIAYFANAERRLRLAVSLVNALLGFATASYTGLLLGLARDVALWANGWLAWLFTVSGLSTALATAIVATRIMGSLTPSTILPEFNAEGWHEALKTLHRYHLPVVIAETIAFVGLLATTAVRYLVAATWMFMGTALPLTAAYIALALAVPIASYKLENKTAMYLTAIAILVGGLSLRLAIITAPQEVEVLLHTP